MEESQNPETNQPPIEPQTPQKNLHPRVWIPVLAVVVLVVGYFVYTGIKDNNAPQPPLNLRGGEGEEGPALSEVDLSAEALAEVEGWQTYRNEEYGFEFRYPEHYQFGVSPYSELPDIEIDDFVPGDPLYIRIYSNQEGYSPEDWAEGTVKYFSDNDIKDEGNFAIDDRLGYYVVFSGGYICRPNEPGCGYLLTLEDEYGRLNFISHGSYMVVVSYPDDPIEYEKILSTFKFIEPN
jgi:hypothetical protein